MGRPDVGQTIARFGRGQVPLARAFWFGGVFGGGMLLLIRWVENAALDAMAFDPMRILATFVAGELAGAGVAIALGVGIWRAASRDMERRRADGRARVAPVAAMAVVVIAAAHLVASGLVDTAPTAAELGRIAFLDDPSVPPFDIRLVDGGTALRIDGGFKHGLADRFTGLAEDAPRLRTIVLNSPGGRVGEAERLRGLIQARGLDTYVAETCISACTVAFAGGRRRWLAPDASLGFHSPSFRGARIGIAGPGDEGDIFKRAGFAPDFIVRALAVGPTHVWCPSAAELLAARVITDVARPGAIAASGE